MSARDLLDDMDTASKTNGVWESVRRALGGLDGEVDLALKDHVVENTISWASDGADRGVGAALTQQLPSLQYNIVSWMERIPLGSCFRTRCWELTTK